MAKKRLVLDASVMIKWIRTEQEMFLKQADKILQDLQEEKVELYAPELAKYEIGNVLVKRKLKSPPIKPIKTPTNIKIPTTMHHI